MKPLKSNVDRNSSTATENRSAWNSIMEEFKVEMKKSLFQGAEKYMDRNRERGKLSARERLELLLDPGSPFLELMPLAGWGDEDQTVGGSIIAGIGVIKGVECLVNVNIHTLKGGALNPVSVNKSARLDDIARENRLPMIYLNESAGADLPQQAKIFNYGGRAFREITRRSKAGIPSITGVFGSSTAGGAYIPGMSDYVVMVDGRAKTYLAGPPLVKMAINEDVDDETLGGAKMHATRSGLADYLASDEVEAIGMIRQIVENLDWIKESSLMEEVTWEEPLYPMEDLFDVVSADVRRPFDPREVIARIADGSKFSEFKPGYGSTLVTGYIRIFGKKVGVLANNGVLFSDSANKGCHFIQLCNKRNIPLLFLQNITGFMVGREAEESGIIKNGSKLVNAVSNSEVPAITIMIGGSYGAGNYGMCGRAYDPRFLFTWPNSRLAVMGADQLVGVLEILQAQKASKKSAFSISKVTDAAKGKVIKEALKKRIEAESNPYFGTGQLWDDGVIDPRQTRDILGICLSVIHNNKVEGSTEYGVFRM